MTTKKSVKLNIEKYTKKGHGVSTYNNTKVIVPKAVVGDEVLLQFNKKRKGFIKAKILQIIKPSSAREIPKCLHFDMCGGCIWQNVKYIKQLEEKEKFIIDVFEDLINDNDDLKIFPIEPSKNIFEYRNKMEFSFSQNRKKTNYLGLIMQGGRFVVDIERCHLASKWVSDLLMRVKI